MIQLLTLIAYAGGAAASYANNLNYRSPSFNHPSLGVAIHKVNKRHAGNEPRHVAHLNFTHGTASGDPYPNSVILWTRVSPTSDNVKDNSTVSGNVPLFNPVPIYGHENEKLPPPSTSPVCVQWKIAEDKALVKVADSGTTYTSSDIDYTLKVCTIHTTFTHEKPSAHSTCDIQFSDLNIFYRSKPAN